MIIVGAGSAGKETSGILMQQTDEEIIFFDQINHENLIWNKFAVYSDFEVIKSFLTNNPEFCVAIGQPRKREKMFDLFLSFRAKPKNIISKNANLLSNIDDNGTIIQPGVCISYDVNIGKSCFIHANSVIGHRVKIGDFTNISPLCSIIGPCEIGNYSYIGAGSIIMPNITIGKKCHITPGSIVNKHLKDYETF
ncbi:MAG: hypothetical protein PHP52_14065 [Bacteroidales bacterium]|nr:hypothetical protein [Bacteroidales bacterium]MDD4217898.1 hypothetical protein [Bacteroidales bacterium]